MTEEYINKQIKDNNLDTNKISDGYHTFKELYDHRIALFIALSNTVEPMGSMVAWKSKLHHDGTMWDGWFIAGLFIEKGEQISYHLPIDKWDALHSEVLERAPEWDGHTPADVIERLLRM